MSELSAKEQLEAMIAGTHENDESLVDDESVNDEEEIQEAPEQEEVEETPETDENEEVSEDIEDTDLEEEVEEEDDTEGEDDGSDPETSEDDTETQEENTQDTEETSEDESENTEEEQTEDAEVDSVNYKEFYEKVALAKFTANGKEVEGFKDPEDLIRAQQMLHGYSDKMKVFKEYKPFIKALEERKITSDSDKFNLAMSLIDGDPEAIKKVLKEKDIDPMELDLENINYVAKDTLPSEAQMLIEETYDQARNLGIDDKFNQVLTQDWDVPSIKELVSNPLVKNDLLKHLSDGTYDKVQTEIRKMELLDAAGVLNGTTSVEKYRMAMGRINQAKAVQPQQVETPEPAVEAKPTIDEVKAKQEAEFKKKAAAEKERKVAEQRKKAASVSKKKTVKKKAPEVKPEALKGDEFKDYFKNMLMS